MWCASHSNSGPGLRRTCRVCGGMLGVVIKNKPKKQKNCYYFSFGIFPFLFVCSLENHIKTINVITVDVFEHNSRYDNARMKN